MESLKAYLNLVDGIVAVVLFLGILGGIRRGLSGELLRVITIVIAIVIGWRFSDQTAAWLADNSDWPNDDLKAVAFFGLIVAVYLILGIIRHGFRLLLDFSFKGKMEYIGGALFGLVRSLVFCAVALLGASMIPSESVQSAVNDSRSGQFAIEHLGPVYTDWAEKHPEFKLPDMKTPEVVEQAIEVKNTIPEDATETVIEKTEEIEDDLGPLIIPDSDSAY
jgi:membrane protein required for colicin V production